MPKTPEQRISAATYKEFVGENLTLARRALQMNQAKMARKLKIAQNRLSQWESGKYYPDPWALKQLCEEYAFTMDWFYLRIRSGVSVARGADLERVEAEDAGVSPAEVDQET